ERPSKPIIAMTHLPGSARQLVLTWGLHWVIVPQLERFKQAVVNSARAALADDFAETEDQILVIAGVPFNVPGSTNILRVAPCEERLIYATDPE
ncbi:MAG: pyruvate kinase alpha/beta domain-containing protein, partial [Pseudomonadota bacterium]